MKLQRGFFSMRLASKFGGFARAFMADDHGQTTTEYILILSVVVMIALKFKQTLVTRLEGTMNTLGTQIDGIVQSDQQ